VLEKDGEDQFCVETTFYNRLLKGSKLRDMSERKTRRKK
jgi:hypothetical protein